MINKKPNYSVGDLVIVDNEVNKIWIIVRVSYVSTFKNGNHNSSVLYHLSSAVRRSIIIPVEEERLFLVCKQAYSNEYLRKLNLYGSPPTMENLKEPRTIDDFLDEISKILSVRDLLGSISSEVEQKLMGYEEDITRLNKMSVSELT